MSNTLLSIRPSLRAPSPSVSLSATCAQVRHATFIRRPKRPYTFTQLVTLSDGSSYLHRTTSPQPHYKSTKDQRNTPLWNPSSQKLLNVETDEAGRLKAFRQKFGRGWDAEIDKGEDGQTATEDNFMDIISGSQKQEKEIKSKAAGNKDVRKAKSA